MRRRTLLRVAGWILATYVLVRVGLNLGEGIGRLREQPFSRSPDWTLIGMSGAIFLIAHATLVQTWRIVLGCWGQHLGFWDAARVWSVSNLGKYLPGKVWAIGAQGAMARELNVSPLAASGSALLGALVNLVAGFVVVLLGGRVFLDRAAPGGQAIAIAFVIAAFAALLLAPFILPRLAPAAARWLGRPVDATLPARAVAYSLIGNVAAWLLYGAAFQQFVFGVLGRSTGDYSEFLSAYTLSYLAGYIVLFMPAGLGVREGVMLTILQFAGLATYPEATLITIGSRVWLTLLEVTPALAFWTHHRIRHPSTIFDAPDVPT